MWCFSKAQEFKAWCGKMRRSQPKLVKDSRTSWDSREDGCLDDPTGFLDTKDGEVCAVIALKAAHGRPKARIASSHVCI